MNLGTGVNPSNSPDPEQAPQTEADKLRQRFQLWYEGFPLPANAEDQLRQLHGRLFSDFKGYISGHYPHMDRPVVMFDKPEFVAALIRTFEIVDLGIEQTKAGPVVYFEMEDINLLDGNGERYCRYRANLVGQDVHDHMYGWEFVDQKETEELAA